MCSNILVPIDTNDDKTWQVGLPAAFELAAKSSSRIHVLTVIPDYMLCGEYPNLAIDRIVNETKKKLEAIIRHSNLDDTQVTLGVEQGGITSEVLRVALELPADLIVMTSHRPKVVDYLRGSNAAHIALHAPCSVHVVRQAVNPRRKAIMNREITEAAYAA